MKSNLVSCSVIRGFSALESRFGDGTTRWHNKDSSTTLLWELRYLQCNILRDKITILQIITILQEKKRAIVLYNDICLCFAFLRHCRKLVLIQNSPNQKQNWVNISTLLKEKMRTHYPALVQCIGIMETIRLVRIFKIFSLNYKLKPFKGV